MAVRSFLCIFDWLRLAPALVAQLEVAETASVVEVAHSRAEADNAADRLDGHHEGGVGEVYAAGVAVEEGEEQLLLRDVPAAVAWREAVGVVPPQLVDALLQVLLHGVGGLLGNDAPHGVGNEDAHHVALPGEALLVGLVVGAGRADK